MRFGERGLDNCVSWLPYRDIDIMTICIPQSACAFHCMLLGVLLYATSHKVSMAGAVEWLLRHRYSFLISHWVCLNISIRVLSYKGFCIESLAKCMFDFLYRCMVMNNHFEGWYILIFEKIFASLSSPYQTLMVSICWIANLNKILTSVRFSCDYYWYFIVASSSETKSSVWEILNMYPLWVYWLEGNFSQGFRVIAVQIPLLADRLVKLVTA